MLKIKVQYVGCQILHQVHTDPSAGEIFRQAVTASYHIRLQKNNDESTSLGLFDNIFKKSILDQRGQIESSEIYRLDFFKHLFLSHEFARLHFQKIQLWQDFEAFDDRPTLLPGPPQLEA